MSQNKGELSMSNFNIGDVVRIGNGKVEYRVDSFPAAGQAFVIGEKSSRTVETARLVLVGHASVEAIESALNTGEQELSRTQSIAEARPNQVTVPEFYNRPEDTEDDFDPREDRRQSAYGLAILAAVMRKNASNPRALAHNSNPLKSVSGKRAKVRKRVRRQRFVTNNLNAQYNELLRVSGYRVKAA